MNYIEVIEKWKINKSEIARRIPMPIGTFNNKINEGQNIYKFTEAEQQKIKGVLFDIATDINSLSDKPKEINSLEPSLTSGMKQVLGEEKLVAKPSKTQTAIASQIKAIEAEKIPAHRNTHIGRQTWILEQKRRIDDLKKQLK